MNIRNVLNSDIPQVVELRNHYVRNDSCTFQIDPYSVAEISEKIAEITKVYPYIVMEEDNEVIGFALLLAGGRNRLMTSLRKQRFISIHNKSIED